MGKYPETYHEGKKYYEVACKKCKNANWKVFSDGKEFVAVCSSCGNQIKLKRKVLKNKPDVEPIPLHLVT